MKNSLGAIFDEIPCTIAHGQWSNAYIVIKFYIVWFLGDSNDNDTSCTTNKDVEKNIKANPSLSQDQISYSAISLNIELGSNLNCSINVRGMSVSPSNKDPVKMKTPEPSFNVTDMSSLSNMSSISNMASLANAPTPNTSSFILDSDLTNNSVVLKDPVPINNVSEGTERSSKHNETFTIETPEKDIVPLSSGVTAFKESLSLTPIQKPSEDTRDREL